MKIFFDENMPFAREFFADFGQLTAFNGRTLCSEHVTDADVLLVRSITKVNQQLLADNKQIKFVGSATIGVDHVDQDYLATRNIPFYSAPGCNAISVGEYVISALVVMAERYLLDLSQLTVGIVGAGNTGSRVSEKLTAIGVKHHLCDPPLAKTDDPRDFVELERVLSCDVICLHVPLTKSGPDATYHLLNQQRLAKLSDQQILINACRGEVIDNKALLAQKQQGHGVKLVLDVWENEPDILLPLIDHADLATAHIAGYSLEGKARGTEMLYRALCHQLHLPVTKCLADFLPRPVVSELNVDAASLVEHKQALPLALTASEQSQQVLLTPMVKMVYDVSRDDALFRQQINQHGFDFIRKTYPTRREFSSLTVNDGSSQYSSSIRALGFS